MSPESQLIIMFVRVHARSHREGDCLIYDGTMGPSGTPLIHTPGKKRRKTRMVRRVLWEYHHGPLGRDQKVFVTCGNKRCVDMAHMEQRTLNFEEVD